MELVTNASTRRGSAVANWGLLVGVTLAALVAAELGLRWRAAVAWEQELRRTGLTAERISYAGSDTPGLYFRVRPLHNGSNSRGFFDVEHAFEKPAGTFRIVVIGDSVVEGIFVGWRNSFARQLESRLREEFLAQRYEVIVLGCSGYSTSQELVLLENEAFRYAPDLIVWSYMLNDPGNPMIDGACGNLWHLYQPRSQLAFLVFKARWKLRVALRERGAPREWYARLHYIYRDEVKANITRIGAICRDHKVPAVFLINPVFLDEPSFDSYPFVQLHQQLRQAASENGLVVLDLLDAYKGSDPHALSLPKDPWHPNREGHRVITTFLMNELAERRLIPTQAPFRCQAPN
jgi:lysophospholipase L1-like esterase